MKKLIELSFVIISFATWGQVIDEQINGISLVSEKSYLLPDQVNPILEVNANWTAVVPYAFVPDKHKPDLKFDFDGQWRGERVFGTYKAIQVLHAKGLKVMLKPQLWVGHDEYAGFIKMKSESDWTSFETNYFKFIMTFVEIAVKENVEMFCIGTELSKFANLRPEFWRKMIEEIRKIYAGKIIYAANWDNYENIDFWSQLDFVGIDAYFPLTKRRNAGYNNLKKGWEKLATEMYSFSRSVGRSIVFTEYGYRSVKNCGVKPWDYDGDRESDERNQWKALKALYDVMWDKDFFEGGFLWKWRPDHANSGGPNDSSYSVQNKKAQKLVSEHYAKWKK